MDATLPKARREPHESLEKYHQRKAKREAEIEHAQAQLAQFGIDEDELRAIIKGEAKSRKIKTMMTHNVQLSAFGKRLAKLRAVMQEDGR